MAVKQYEVKITADVDDFTKGMNEAEGKASGLGDKLGDNVSRGANKATDSLEDVTEELRKLQREAMGAKTSVGGVGGSLNKTSGESNKFNNEMKKLSMVLGRDVPESTKQAYKEMIKLHKEARSAQRLYGKYSQEALSARDAITTFALGLDDTTFKQIYMRSQLGLTNAQLRQQANSIKLNARMTKLMGNQTQILTQRMQGLAKHGIKPDDLLPPGTIGQFQLMNETMSAGKAAISKLSGAYRLLGTRMEKSIKGWSAQKMAIKAAQGDMVKYGLLLRGITAAQMNLTMAVPIVGMAALYAYKTMFTAALEADKGLQKLAKTVKGKVLQAFKPLRETVSQFLEVALKVTGMVADWISKFNEAHPIISKVTSVISFLLPAMTLLLLPLQMGIGLWKGWAVAINGAWTMIGGIVSMIGVASSTFLVLAGIIGALVVAFIHLWKTNEGFRDACIGIWEAIKTTIQTALDNIKQFFITHGDTIKLVLQTAYETLKNIVMTVMNAIGEIVNIVLTSIKEFWSKHGDTVTQAVTSIYQTVKMIVQSFLQAVSDFIKIILDNIKQFWDKHGDSLKQVVKSAWEMIKTIITNVLKFIETFILAVSSAINGDWDTFWDEMGNIVKIAWDTIGKFIKFAIQNIPKIILAGASLAESAIKSLLKGVLNAAKTFGKDFISAGLDLVKGLAEGIRNGLSRAVNAVKDVVNAAIDKGKALLGINSPSKLFMQFGEWTTEGYEIGVNKGEPGSTRSIENFANNSIEAFSTNVLPQNNSNDNSVSENTTNNIYINAGALNNEQDLYKLAEIIDRKLLEIKQRNSKMFGGYQHGF